MERLAVIADARRRWGPYAAPLAAVGLATVAIVAAILISHTSSPDSSHSSFAGSSPLPAPAYPTPVLRDALTPEAGPDGTAWQWIGRDASLKLESSGHSWVAFRALSQGFSRTLDFRGPAGERLSTRVQTTPDVYLVGPLSPGRVVLRVSPATPPEDRLAPLSIFLSAVRAMPNPVAVVPGVGFWNTESAGGVVFNWLRDTGIVDVYAPRRAIGRVWVSFVARSLGRERIVTAQANRMKDRVAIGTTAHAVSLGPFELVDGRAQISLHASPGARREGRDPRPLSVQVAALGGYTSLAEA